MATEKAANLHDRVVTLEHLCRQHGEQIEDMGGTLDHAMNTIDTILLPTQKSHSEKLTEYADETRAVHYWMLSQKGAWAFIQRFGIVVAALSSVAVMVMKVLGK